MKKLVILLLVLLLAFSNVFAVYADSTDKETKSEEKILKEQSKSLDKYDKLVAKVQNIKKNGKEAKYDSTFGGVYLDENQQLVVCATDISEMRSMLEMDEVEYKVVKKSIKDLEKNMKKVEKLDPSLFVSASLQIADNQILIKVSAEGKAALEDAISKKKIDNVVIEETILVNSLTATSIKNGVYVDAKESPGSYVTVGIAVRDASTNDPGVLIPGHINTVGAKVGSTIRLNGDKIGEIDKLQFSGTVDAAFVNTNRWGFDSHTPTKTFMNGDYYTSADSSYVVEGLYVNMYGGTSGRTGGYIESTSATSAGITDLVECDYVGIHGDSGGAVKFERWVGSASTVPTVLSTQSSSLLATDGSWVPGVSKTYSSKINNIFSALNLKNY